MMLGLTNTIGDRVTLEAFGIYNKLKLNTYRPLTYTQISNMDANYNLDFSRDPNDYYCYDYNRNEFEDYMFLGNAMVKLSENAKFTVKPYFWSDEGYYLETVTQPNGQNRIRRWDMDHSLFGGLTQFRSRLAGIDYSVGYLYHNQKRPGPPTSWKLYKVTAGKLTFDKYSILSNDSRYEMHSPILTAKYSVGPLILDGGLKYVRFQLPSIITYKADSAWGDVEHEDALSRNPVIDEAASARNPKVLTQVLPNATLTGVVTRQTSLHLAYGKNFVTHVDIYPYFMSQRSTFQAAGITFDQLWKDREMECSDNFELGLRHAADRWSMVPTVYYSIHNNKQAVLYDAALGATYPRNDASAAAYGAEIELKVNPFKNFSCYGSFSYNRFYFSQDINSDKDSSMLHIKNFQVPDAPEFLAKALASYKIAGIAVSPILRYTSVRYGDVLHNEKINASTAFDIDISYNHDLFKFRNVELAATFMNILNRKDVALMSTSDYKTLKTSYQPVAPFTVMGSLTLNY
ncbi:MAG: outer membrane beta-barrel protein [Fibrobacterota bacterium]